MLAARFLTLSLALCVDWGQWCGSSSRAVQASEPVPPFPTPYTANNRVLGLICHYNLDHIDSMYIIFQEYLSMCEGGWDPKIVLFTTADYTPPLRRIVKYRTYCYRKVCRAQL